MTSGTTKTPSKKDKLADALRANLLKRKQQSRNRAAETESNTESPQEKK